MCSRPSAAPPNVEPMLGVNNQSARADAGASTSASAAIIAHFLNISTLPRPDMAVQPSPCRPRRELRCAASLVRQQATYPATDERRDAQQKTGDRSYGR